MALRVVIDDEVAKKLQERAEPLVDSVNSVLRRLLGLSVAEQSSTFFEIEEVHMPRGKSAARSSARRSRTSRNGKAKHARRPRAPKGSLLDEKAYWKPVLEVLANSPEGSAPAREVVEAVGDKVRDRLTQLDLEDVDSGGLRWQTRVMFARLRMKDAGLIAKDSPRGIWQITGEGRQALADGRLEVSA